MEEEDGVWDPGIQENEHQEVRLGKNEQGQPVDGLD